jgi:hypothetical protein
VIFTLIHDSLISSAFNLALILPLTNKCKTNLFTFFPIQNMLGVLLEFRAKTSSSAYVLNYEISNHDISHI